MEKKLNLAKQFNKIAALIIVIMLILMGAMTANMHHLAEQYRWLETKYEELYEEVEEINRSF